jgi:hypothetical protein
MLQVRNKTPTGETKGLVKSGNMRSFGANE